MRVQDVMTEGVQTISPSRAAAHASSKLSVDGHSFREKFRVAGKNTVEDRGGHRKLTRSRASAQARVLLPLRFREARRGFGLVGA